jgi:general L-amino acid transport system substrate-binding protein
MNICKTLIGVAVAGLVASAAAPAHAQATLKAVKDRGTLNCGVNEGLIGFATKDDKGKWSGFDVDFCRAMSAAIFGDPDKVAYTPLSTEQRFDALKSGKIDILSRNSTWTMSREVGPGLLFAGVTYYDGQGFLLKRAAEVSSALDIAKAKICALTGTTSFDNVSQYLKSQNVEHELVPVAHPAEMVKAYASGACSVMTSDVSQLHALRLQLANPADQMILPDVISKEPLGPVVRQDDVQWFEIAKWVNFAMIDAEELGVSTRTIDAALASKKPDVMRLVGTEGTYGEQLGLARDWAAKVVRTVGNYGDVFERNVGARSPLGIPRGLNQLWSHGGILYAPPIR